MQKEKQTALLLITHDLSVVRSMADRIAVMYSGKIVEEAPAKELLENPLHPYTKGLWRQWHALMTTKRICTDTRTSAGPGG